jgi:hypothetical protein
VRAAGIVLLVVGVVAGIALWLAAGQRYDDAVRDLAPVPIGCTTTLQFDRTGTYLFFVETTGTVGEIDGDCQNDDHDYDVAADDAPRVSLSLLDDQGDELDLDRVDGPSYDRAGRRGVGVRTVDIDETGDYELTATATVDDTDVVVRVGRDPSSGVAALRAGGVTTLLLGVAAGLLLLLVSGRRRPEPAPVTASGPQWPLGPHPAAPLAPPSANPPIAPPYTPRPPSYGPYRPPEPQPQPRHQPADRPPGGWPGRGEPLPPPTAPR